MDEADFMILAMIESQGHMEFVFGRVPSALRFRLGSLVSSGTLAADHDQVTSLIEGTTIVRFMVTDFGRQNLRAYTG